MNNFNPQKIKDIRTRNGISQKELGEKLGISNKAVSKWENGLGQPSSQNLLILSKIFNVPVEFFFTEEIKESKKKSAGMESLTELYKIGRGPSSSHTIGPEKACEIFKARNPDADAFKAVLYGSLAGTGKGHGTDVVIKKTLSPVPCRVDFNFVSTDIPHPNTMDLFAYRGKTQIDSDRIISVGGGTVRFEKNKIPENKKIYSLSTFSQISEYCTKKSIRLWEYVLENEYDGFEDYMHKIWRQMKKTVEKGISDSGVLPGGLDVQKKAGTLFNSRHIDESSETKENRLVCSYAFAVCEQNASGEVIVTAPTCGSSGIVPAVLYYQQQKNGFDDDSVVHALMTAGIVGNLIKTNASISGAECGCQAEVGSACAMAAAALAELFELGIEKIEYSAEIAIEHHLGLTCDPICGLVQIPCIERNAVAAMRAINAVSLASFLWDTRKISFDGVVQTMKETGDDMHTSYKETAKAGLAKIRISKTK